MTEQNREGDRRRAAWLANEADNTLDSLLGIVEPGGLTVDGHVETYNGDIKYGPWEAGYELEFSAFGGLRNMEHRQIVIAAEYSSFVSSHQDTWITGNYDSTFKTSSTYKFATPGGGDISLAAADRVENNEDVNWGEDNITVNGNSTVLFSNRTYMMTANYTRNWNGITTRLAPMEGVICGGFFTQTYVGLNMVMSPLCSGDVYGGSARAAGVRLGLSGLHYRSSDLTNLAMGVWVRACSMFIEPPVPTHRESGIKKKNWASKILFSALPFLEIAWGIVCFPMAIKQLAQLLGRKVMAKIRAARAKQKTAGAEQETVGSDLTT